MERTNKPIWQMKAGSFFASIWENERNMGGKLVKVREVSFQKRYRNDAGEYATSNRYQINEIPKAMVVLAKAYEQLLAESASEGGEQNE